jgi:archaellum biogenesis ATPase FlaH
MTRTKGIEKISQYKKLYKIIRGQEILTVDDENIEPIIEGILYPKDYTMIVAEEKMGKTIIAQQLNCNLTTGKPFLGSFNIIKPVKVWHFLTEGKENDIKDRYIRMSHGIDINVDNLTLIPTLFRFNTEDGIEALREIIEEGKNNRPDVIIIDSLYPAIKGSLRDEEVVNDFHHIIRAMQNELNCAVILIHHFSKRSRTPDGKIIERSDKDSFGSAFFGAAVDHVIWLDKWAYDGSEDKGNDKILKCDTQRSGKIFDSIRIRLNEPDPLYFEAVSKHLEERHRITEILKSSKNLILGADLMKRARVGRTVMFQVLKDLENSNNLIREGSDRNRKYGFKNV